MIICKEIDAYIHDIDSGKTFVSTENRQLIDNIVLPLLKRSDVRFDSGLYYTFLDFCTKYYYELLPYQKFLASFHFMYYLDDTLVFNEYFYYLGRGNGKDGFIGPLINFFQTKHFPVKEYDIDIVANSETQARGTFEVVYNMTQRPEFERLMKRSFKINKEEIISRVNNSKLNFNTSNGKTKDGKRPGCIVFNEYHAYPNYDQIKVHSSGLGKKKYPRIIGITTDGDVRDGPLDDKLQTAREKVLGMHEDLRFFPFICKIDEGDDYTDLDVIEKANPSVKFLDTLRTQILDELTKIKVQPSLFTEFMTKRMNLPKREETKCVTSWDNIEACTRDVPNLEGHDAILAIDYASFRDFVSVGVLFFENGEWIWLQKSFVCKNSPTISLVKFPLDVAKEHGEVIMCDGDFIDNELIRIYIEELLQNYNIVSAIIDNFRFAILKDMFEKFGFSLRTRKNKYGNLILCRSGEYTHTLVHPVLEKCFEEHSINFGSSRIMRWYTNNVKVETTSRGNKRYDKINPESRKTDGFMAFVHAFSEREELQNTSGLLVFDEY